MKKGSVPFQMMMDGDRGKDYRVLQQGQNDLRRLGFVPQSLQGKIDPAVVGEKKVSERKSKGSSSGETVWERSRERFGPRTVELSTIFSVASGKRKDQAYWARSGGVNFWISGCQERHQEY